ncbi:hypothetical protein Tco_0792661 [Tanacetum coccineum]
MESSNYNSKERELQLSNDSPNQGTHLHGWFEHSRPSSFRLINLQERILHGVICKDLSIKHSEPVQDFLPPKGRDLLENLDTLEAVIHRAVITYGRLQLQSQDAQINPVQAVDDSLNVSKSSWIESENNNALSTSVNETQLQQHESLVTESTTLEVNLNTDVKALDAGLVITESSRTKSDKHDTSSNLRTYITHDVDADIRLVNDQVPFAEVDSNTTPDSTNMCHRGGEIDQDAEHDQVKSPLLKAEFLKTNDMVEKEVYNELSNRFLQLEKHCISLEISIQQKEESFQSNKPCKNQDSPEFREFFEINELKAQLQAKNSTINNLKEQIKNVHEKSNEAKVKHDIDVIETINIELEHNVLKYFKKMSYLKQTYKELYDIYQKKTRIQTKVHNDSLIAQVNSKTVENADLKAQIQEKFAKPSILGKPVLQPPRNQSVVRQPNAFKSERPNFSKPRFASQVDVNDVLSKPVTPYYLPKVREYVLAKPHHVIAPGSFRNSQEEPYLILKCSTSVNPLKGRLGSLVTKKDLISHTSEFKEFKSDEHSSNDVWTKQFKPRSSSYDVCSHQFRPRSSTMDVVWTKQFKPVLHQKDVWTKLFRLGVKSISLTEAEDAVAREVHATHARIVSGPDLEPMQEDQTGSNSGKLHVSLAGSNPEHMDDEFLATAYLKSSDSNINSSSDCSLSRWFITKQPSSLVTPPPINTEATTIITSLPEITPFISLQLRVARLEQEMSEVKKTDHSADVLASIKSQVPTVVDKYLGTKLDDALLKILERHTADLIEKYSALPGPESIKNQESEKSPKEIIRIKREQGEEKQD